MTQIDQLNMSIISHLTEGRKPYKKIAVALGVSENTIKARVRKLEQDGILKIAGYVDPEAMLGHQIIYIGAKLKDMNYVSKGEEVSKLHGVVSVGVVTGRYDLLITVHLQQGFDLLKFLSEELSKVDRIESIESFMVYKGFEIKVPFTTDDINMDKEDNEPD